MSRPPRRPAASDRGGRAPCGCSFHGTGQVNGRCAVAIRLSYAPDLLVAGSPGTRAYSAHLNAARAALAAARQEVPPC